MQTAREADFPTAQLLSLPGKLGEQQRRIARLQPDPTRRAESTQRYFDWQIELANYDGNGDYNNCGANTGNWREKTVPAGSLPPNPWGLHEVLGNVWEWVEDEYRDSYSGAPADGSARRGDGGPEAPRVLRGGSWLYFPWFLRSAFRNGDTPDEANDDVGFRLARTL